MMLLMCMVFVCGGVLIVAKGPVTSREYIGGYGSVIFFGFCACAAVLRLVAPPRLMLSPEGLALFNGFRTRSYGWSEFSRFVIYSPARTRAQSVGYVRENRAGEEPGFTKRLTGIDGGFGGGWSVGPSTVVELLNSAKDRWGKGSDEGLTVR
ncbi:PH domain-containing protein [Pleomorphomonas oryzae]|uniref:PH domain-containing protein n=1 Tax=Pleomorphomonas oryzae TaxID=261934 RepID=UPI00047D82FD|nr:PH domain-containing protein [Pleomorphomonas oryzae]